MSSNSAYPSKQKPRQVTLSVGGLQAGKRVDYVPDFPINQPITANTHVSQPYNPSTVANRTYNYY